MNKLIISAHVILLALVLSSFIAHGLPTPENEDKKEEITTDESLKREPLLNPVEKDKDGKTIILNSEDLTASDTFYGGYYGGVGYPYDNYYYGSGYRPYSYGGYPYGGSYYGGGNSYYGSYGGGYPNYGSYGGGYRYNGGGGYYGGLGVGVGFGVGIGGFRGGHYGGHYGGHHGHRHG